MFITITGLKMSRLCFTTRRTH